MWKVEAKVIPVIIRTETRKKWQVLGTASLSRGGVTKILRRFLKPSQAFWRESDLILFINDISAPLVCEGSIRLLRAFQNAPENAFRSGDSSSSSMEQIPFANDNCGTIRSRDSQLVLKSSNSVSHPCTPRRNIHNVFIDDMNVDSG